MSEVKVTTITGKVTKAMHGNFNMASKDFGAYLGKTITVQIKEVAETIVTEKPGATVTETKKTPVI